MLSGKLFVFLRAFYEIPQLFLCCFFKQAFQTVITSYWPMLLQITKYLLFITLCGLYP